MFIKQRGPCRRRGALHFAGFLEGFENVFVPLAFRVMKPSVEYVKARYSVYNSLCFEGRLPEVPVVLSNADSFLGKACFVLKVDQYGVPIGYKDLSLKINAKYDRSKDEIDDVIIHEMIHLYIVFHNIHDESPHGPVFRSIMNQINDRFCRHIEVSHKSALNEGKTGQPAGGRVICITQFNDREHGITVCSNSRVFRIMEELPRRYRIMGMRWYYSDDPYFNLYPKSLTPKIYRIEENVYLQHIKNATELTYDGKKLSPKKIK